MNQLDFSSVIPSLGYLFGTGMAVTLAITLVAAFCGVALGALLALARLSGIRWLAFAAACYVNAIRSVPLLILIFGCYFMLPILGAWVTGSSFPLQVGPFRAALVSFTLFEAAYFCEIIRSGLQSIPQGQISAGRSIGLTPLQVTRYIVLPQAFRNMIPPLLMRSLILFQDTSLVYVVSLTDFLGAATEIGQRDGTLTGMFIFVAAVYFVICFTVSKLVNRLDRRLRLTTGKSRP